MLNSLMNDTASLLARRSRRLTVAALMALTATAAGTAQASLMTYTSRSAFEAELAIYAVDGFDSITSGVQNYSNGDYSIDLPVEGCQDFSPFFSNCPAMENFDSHYVHLSSINDAGQYPFNFNVLIQAFGFDYQAYNASSQANVFSLAGEAAPMPLLGDSQFFGVINFSGYLPDPVMVLSTQSHVMLDNVTYGWLPQAQVPTPGSFVLLASSLAALSVLKRRRAAI
jgi:hypothetical protein